tara:strand:+ start:18956 stop:19705 length:750 start_codon:yes stop_codon:yes gene_type:complete
MHHKNANMRLIELDLTATHISLYNALFLLWNNCGFATEMSINRNDVMMLSKIGSNNTYLKCLKELDKCEMIKYKPSHNPLIGSKINLCRFDTSSDIVVTEFCTTTDTSSDTTTAPLYKLLNKETIKLINDNYSFVNSNIKDWLKDINPSDDDSFILFWNTYSKKVDRVKCENKWNRLKQSDKDVILNTVKKYVNSTPDSTYRKNPLTYLNGKCWNDEIVLNNNNNNLKSENNEQLKQITNEIRDRYPNL